MAGSIDPRCEKIRGTHWPVEVAGLFGTRVAENHLGQRSQAASTGRTYGCKRSDQTIKKLLRHGGRPHMGPRVRGDDVGIFSVTHRHAPTDTASRSRGAFRPRFAIEFPYPPIRGRRECRAPDAPDSRVCNGSSRTHTRWSGHTGITRHSPRNGLRLIRDLPGDRAFLPPSSALLSCELDTSVGVSEPHDFAVRLGLARLARQSVHRIPCPTSVTFAKRPSGWDGTSMDMK